MATTPSNEKDPSQRHSGEQAPEDRVPSEGSGSEENVADVAGTTRGDVKYVIAPSDTPLAGAPPDSAAVPPPSPIPAPPSSTSGESSVSPHDEPEVQPIDLSEGGASSSAPQGENIDAEESGAAPLGEAESAESQSGASGTVEVAETTGTSETAETAEPESSATGMPPVDPVLQDLYEPEKMLVGLRKWAAKSKFGRGAETAVKTVGAGVAANWITKLLTNRSFFQNWLFGGGWTATPAASALSTIGAAFPLAIPWLRQLFAYVRHGTNVNDAFNAIFDRPEDAADAASRLKQFTQWNDTDRGQLLVRTRGEIMVGPGKPLNEQMLLQALHHSEYIPLDQLPYFHTEERYAKYCYTRLIELCADVTAGRNIDGFSPDELEALRVFNMTNDLSRQQCDVLLRVSVAYGRALALRERQRTEKEVTCGTIGSTAAIGATTGVLAPGFILPAAVAGGGLLWRWIQGKQLAARTHLEITREGDLQERGGGPLTTPEARVVRGGNIWNPELRVSEGQLSDDEKALAEAMDTLDLPDDVGGCSSVDALAARVGPVVETHLPSSPKVPRKPDKTRVEDQERIVQGRKDELEDVKAALEQDRGAYDRNVALLGAGRRSPSDPAVATLNTAIGDLNKRIQTNIGRMQELRSPRNPDSIPAAERELEKLKKEVTSIVTSANIARSVEVRRAFAVWVRKLWKKIDEDRKAGRGKRWATAGSVAKSDATKEILKFTGKYVLPIVGIGALGYGSALWLAPKAALGTSYFVSPLVWGGIGLAAGTAAFLWNRLKK